MRGFLLLHRTPRQIALVGLDGGSPAKFRQHHLPDTQIEVVAINHRVIARRDRGRGAGGQRRRLERPHRLRLQGANAGQDNHRRRVPAQGTRLAATKPPLDALALVTRALTIAAARDTVHAAAVYARAPTRHGGVGILKAVVSSSRCCRCGWSIAPKYPRNPCKSCFTQTRESAVVISWPTT